MKNFDKTKHYIFAFLFFLFSTFNLLAQGNQKQNEASNARWSEDKANEWYANQPWPCGFNYVPANAISYTEMWMPYCFDTAFIATELALAEAIGFNCLRVVLPWYRN